MKVQIVLAVTLTALLGACSAPGPGGIATSPSHPAPLTCKVGEPVAYNPDTFHMDVTVLEGEDPETVQILTSYPDIGKSALPLHRSKAPRLKGDGFLTFELNINANRLGSSIPYLNGPALCAGMALIQTLPGGFVRVTIPVRGGDGLGQASLVLPRGAILAMNIAFVPCIETSFPSEFNPELTAGRFKGRPNMQCNKPGSTPGVSHATERARSGKAGELYVFIHGSTTSPVVRPARPSDFKGV